MERTIVQWETDSSVGEFRSEQIEQFCLDTQEVPHFHFDQDYLAEQHRSHGGVPTQQFFRASDRRIYRVGRFINSLAVSDIESPLRPSFMDTNIDARFFWSRAHLATLETYQQGLGAYLLPFAFLYNETLPPDEMDPMYMDCLCFDYRAPGTPKILLWFNDPAVGEFYRCEELGQNPRTEIDYRRCTMPVADSFSDFTNLIAASENEVT